MMFPCQGVLLTVEEEDSGTELSEALDGGAVTEHTNLAPCERSTKAHVSL